MRFQDRVDYSLDEKVALITLDRSDRLNAFDGDMYEGSTKPFCAIGTTTKLGLQFCSHQAIVHSALGLTSGP